MSLIAVVYIGLVAMVQTDMKKLVAYSSIAHLGFVMLGLFAADLIAWQGALLQMVNHGLSTGALFLCVGMLYDRRHTKQFAEFGGLAKVMPVFAFFLVFSTLASVGLPALNGFAGEFLILAGSYRALGWPAAVATFGVVLAAIYLFIAGSYMPFLLGVLRGPSGWALFGAVWCAQAVLPQMLERAGAANRRTHGPPRRSRDRPWPRRHPKPRQSMRCRTGLGPRTVSPSLSTGHRRRRPEQGPCPINTAGVL